MLTQTSVATSTGSLNCVESAGAGPTVLMIHGGSYSSAVFRKQFQSPLATSHRLIAVDLPGHGGSADATDPAQQYSIRGFTQAIADFIERMRLEHVVIYGWSLGGHIALELIGHPDVSGVMASGAPPVSRGPIAMLQAFQTSWDMLLASKESFSERDILRFHQLCFPNGADAEVLDGLRRADGRVRPILVRSLMRGEGVDEKRAVEFAKIPVAIVNGENEPFVRLRYLENLRYSSLWHESCQVLANAGHAPFWDQPGRFNALLERFADDAVAYRPSVAVPGRLSA